MPISRIEITLHKNKGKSLMLYTLLNHRAIFNTGATPGAQIHNDTAGAFFDFYFEVAGVALDAFKICVGDQFDI
jgi:hypothetical protein